MTINAKEKGLYRLRLSVWSRWSQSQEPDAVAYTYWVRHDDKDIEERLNNALARLMAAYCPYSAVAVGIERKDYIA